MSKRFFKLLFGTMVLVAASAFTACTEDNKMEVPEAIANPTVLNFTSETPLTQTVALLANCEWKVETSGLDWATVTPASGQGNAVLTVTAEELPAGVKVRTGKISFKMIHAELGPWGVSESVVTVNQTADGSVVPPPDAEPIYFNNFDKAVAEKTYGSGTSYPYLDQFDGWQNQTGTGAADVAYEYTGMSARSNSTSNSSYSDYAGSGSNNLFFGANAVFTIQKIAVNTKNLQLTFGAERYSQSGGSVFVHDDFLVQLSADGTLWSKALTYSFAKGTDPDGRWDLATADFTLPDDTKTLYVRFTSKVASVHRLDDVKLTAGVGGQDVAFTENGGGDEPQPPVTDAIYFNNFDKAVATNTYGSGTSWPFLDQSDCWQNQAGTGAADVTYSYTGMSARANSTSDGTYSDYAGSGSNNLFFGTDAVFTIEKIAVSTRNLKLTFGAERYSTSAGSDFKHDDFLVELSGNGSSWSSPLTYSFAKGTDPSGRWDLATADFTLPENTTTLYIRFTSKVASAHRLDDVTLAAGNGGQAVSFDNVAAPTGSGYVRVSSVTAGKRYLLVAETGTANYVFDASLLASGKVNGTPVTVAENAIESNATTDAYAVTIAASGNGYTMQTAAGKYVEYAGSSTNLAVNDTATRTWLAETSANETICFVDEGTSTASTVRCLLFQNSSTYQRFGGYAKQNANNGEYVTIALYELGEGGSTGGGDKPGDDTTGRSDDFSTLGTSTSYGAQTTKAGWVGANVAVQSGGASDTNPVFKSLLGESTDTKGMVINGKTTAVGSITSPVLSGGCGKLTFNYGYAFSEANGIDFKVEIMQNGTAVKTYNVTFAKAEVAQYTKYEFSETVGVSGDFQIVITNNSPSKSTSNKDRYTIFNISWTGNK